MPRLCACPQYPANALAHRGELLAYITSDRIRSNAQLDGALDYLGKVRARCLLDQVGRTSIVLKCWLQPGGALGCLGKVLFEAAV